MCLYDAKTIIYSYQGNIWSLQTSQAHTHAFSTTATWLPPVLSWDSLSRSSLITVTHKCPYADTLTQPLEFLRVQSSHTSPINNVWIDWIVRWSRRQTLACCPWFPALQLNQLMIDLTGQMQRNCVIQDHRPWEVLVFTQPFLLSVRHTEQNTSVLWKFLSGTIQVPSKSPTRIVTLYALVYKRTL